MVVCVVVAVVVSLVILHVSRVTLCVASCLTACGSTVAVALWLCTSALRLGQRGYPSFGGLSCCLGLLRAGVAKPPRRYHRVLLNPAQRWRGRAVGPAPVPCGKLLQRGPGAPVSTRSLWELARSGARFLQRAVRPGVVLHGCSHLCTAVPVRGGTRWGGSCRQRVLPLRQWCSYDRPARATHNWRHQHHSRGHRALQKRVLLREWHVSPLPRRSIWVCRSSG
jgi:hypothetical protein